MLKKKDSGPVYSAWGERKGGVTLSWKRVGRKDGLERAFPPPKKNAFSAHPGKKKYCQAGDVKKETEWRAQEEERKKKDLG